MNRLIVLLAVATVLLAGCAAGPNDAAGPSEAGFWLGVWHGVIHPVTFVVSLFNHNVNLYEVHNNGGWYNFGFVLGIGILATVFGPGRQTAARTTPSRRKRAD